MFTSSISCQNTIDELCNDDLPDFWQNVALNEEAVAADGGDSAVREGEGSSRGRRFNANLQDGDHILVYDRSAVSPGL